MSMEVTVIWTCDQCGLGCTNSSLDLPEGWWVHNDCPGKHFHSLKCCKKWVTWQKERKVNNGNIV